MLVGLCVEEYLGEIGTKAGIRNLLRNAGVSTCNALAEPFALRRAHALATVFRRQDSRERPRKGLLEAPGTGKTREPGS